MNTLGIAYCLLTVALTAVAIYVQVTSSNLSFPLPTATTVLIILLPLISAANLFYLPRLQGYLRPRRQSSPWLRELLPPLIQIVQGILTVVLATLTAEGFVPGHNLDCGLQHNWQGLWSAHDARAIERIQDTFNCCGFRTVKHEAWPIGQCAQLYKRHTACIGPWRAAMQRTAGIGFAVAVVVGLLQFVQLARYRVRDSSLAYGDSTARYRRLAQSIGADPSDGLLEDGDAADSNEQSSQSHNQRENDRSRVDYGAVEDGQSPRVQPSGLGDDRPRW